MTGIMEMDLATDKWIDETKCGLKLYRIFLRLIKEGNSNTSYNMNETWAQGSHENTSPLLWGKVTKTESRMGVTRCWGSGAGELASALQNRDFWAWMVLMAGEQ